MTKVKENRGIEILGRGVMKMGVDVEESEECSSLKEEKICFLKVCFYCITLKVSKL